MVAQGSGVRGGQQCESLLCVSVTINGLKLGTYKMALSHTSYEFLSGFVTVGQEVVGQT